jgi:hypothetical protein
MAIANMDNVHTLRIIFGHWNLTIGLLRGFLGSSNPGRSKLKKLWLENCCLEGLGVQLYMELKLTQLESIRLRRIYISSVENLNGIMYIPTRGGVPWLIQDGRGSSRTTTVVYGENQDQKSQMLADEDELLKGVVRKYDELIYQRIAAERERFPSEEKMHEALRGDPLHLPISPKLWLTRVFRASAHTLTSLNLDWVLWPAKPNPVEEAADMLGQLSELRFSNLRAFQLRNTVVDQTKIPDGIYLLDDGENKMPSFLGFMENHPKLQCIGWPMDRFLSHRRSNPETALRTREVINTLSHTLRDIRLDYDYSSGGELFTETPTSWLETEALIRRRKFIDEFARHMTAVEQLKMEGGIPRDEKRETVRALRLCPLQKIVMIGVSCPLGNTWGLGAEKLKAVDLGNQNYAGTFEEESDEQIHASMAFPPQPPPSSHFEPTYGWPPGPPMIHTIASYHVSTITELKFCGYNGSPILHFPSPVTEPMLHPLRYFHKLERLIISMWLLTYFEGDNNDESIVAYWVDQRSPASRALVRVMPPEHRTSSWSERLTTFYSPEALAKQVATQIAPHISPQAKNRPGGVSVRASFCLGVANSDIFDLDVTVGANDEVLEFKGPREEREPSRTKEKLGQRRWF